MSRGVLQVQITHRLLYGRYCHAELHAMVGVTRRDTGKRVCDWPAISPILNTISVRQADDGCHGFSPCAVASVNLDKTAPFE